METLHRNADCHAYVGIPAVVKVITVVHVDDIDIVVVVPVIPPILWPWVNHAEPIALVLESGVSTDNKKREPVNAEIVFPAEVSAETIFGNAVTVIATTLFPIAVVGIPVLGAMLLPRSLLDMLLFRRAFSAIIVALLSLFVLLILALALLLLSFFRPLLLSMLLRLFGLLLLLLERAVGTACFLPSAAAEHVVSVCLLLLLLLLRALELRFRRCC